MDTSPIILVKVLKGSFGRTRGDTAQLEMMAHSHGVRVVVRWEDRDEVFWLAGNPEVKPNLPLTVHKGDPTRSIQFMVLEVLHSEAA